MLLILNIFYIQSFQLKISHDFSYGNRILTVPKVLRSHLKEDIILEEISTAIDSIKV